MPARQDKGDHSALRWLGLAFALCIASTLAFAQTITEFPIPSPDVDAWDICVGPDGALWFNEPLANKIGRITMDGAITEFPTVGGAYSVTPGPDGNIWFTTGNQVGRMTTSGQVTTFEIPDPSGETTAFSIVAGSDGNLWFSDLYGRIGRVTPTGTFTFFDLSFPHPVPGLGGPYGVTVGPDGAVWYAGGSVSAVGKVTPDGTVTNYSVTPGFRYGITHARDGALWLTDDASIERITTQGDSQTIGSTSGGALAITPGPDGNLWFSEASSQKIGRITPTGVVTEFDLPGPHPVSATAGAWGIVAGPDGNIWFVVRAENMIGRFEIQGRLRVEPVHRSDHPRVVPPRPQER